MSSKFLDSMLTKYQAEAAGAVAGGSSYSSQHARMYPYVSAMGQSGFPAVAGYSNALANAAESAANAADKNCRYPTSAAAAASMVEAMANYSLGQNGVANAAAASMAQAAAQAAGFYQAASAGGAAAAAAAAAAGVDPNNPLSACSHGGPPTGLGALAGVQASGGPDIPRYPWMSITGECALFRYFPLTFTRARASPLLYSGFTIIARVIGLYSIFRHFVDFKKRVDDDCDGLYDEERGGPLRPSDPYYGAV